MLALQGGREPTERGLNSAMGESGNIASQDQRLQIDGSNLICHAQDENDIANELMDRYGNKEQGSRSKYLSRCEAVKPYSQFREYGSELGGLLEDTPL